MSLAVVFHEKKEAEQEYVLKRLQGEGFVITQSSIPRMVLIHISNDSLEREAERINLLILNQQNILQTFFIENRSQFLSLSSSSSNHQKNTIFKPSERNLLLFSLMEQVGRLGRS